MDDPTWMCHADLRREVVRLRQAIAEHADTVCAAGTPAVAAVADRRLWRHVDVDPCQHGNQQQIDAGHATGWLCLACDRIVQVACMAVAHLAEEAEDVDAEQAARIDALNRVYLTSLNTD